jgi:hypothetical protein
MPGLPAPAGLTRGCVSLGNAFKSVFDAHRPGRVASEVAGDPLDFPVAIAGGLRSAAAIHFFRPVTRFPVDFGAAGSRFFKGSSGSRTELAPRSVLGRRGFSIESLWG